MHLRLIFLLALQFVLLPRAAFGDITLETGNTSASPVNNAAHQNVCASRGTVDQTSSGASVDGEGGFDLGISSLTSGTTSSTTSMDVISSGNYRICFSFAATGPQLPEFAWTWLGWASWVVGAIIEGNIYISRGVPGAAVVGRHVTTPQQDRNWINYMTQSRVGTIDGYSVARHNCRKFSQLEFADAPLHW